MPRPPSSQRHGNNIVAFIEDPDGHRIELMQLARCRMPKLPPLSIRRPPCPLNSAMAYITRMRDDKEFHQAVNELSEDEDASWAFIKESGYDFTLAEFKEAQDAVYKERGITPM